MTGAKESKSFLSSAGAVWATISKILEVGQSLYVKDLELPKTARVLVAPETVVATVTAKLTEEEDQAVTIANTKPEEKKPKRKFRD